MGEGRAFVRAGGVMVSLPLKPKLLLHESFPIPPLGHRLGPVARVKFQEDSVLELVNRRETQAEFIGDFFVKQSLRQATHHVMLSVGQASEFFARS